MKGCVMIVSLMNITYKIIHYIVRIDKGYNLYVYLYFINYLNCVYV